MTAWVARRLGVVGLVIALLTPGCAVRGLSFVADTRVEILQPEENARLTLPFTVSWTAEDFDGSFAVFFDRSPMRPNQSLKSLVPEDDPCHAEPDCPDAGWLAERDVYVTDARSVTVEYLPDRRENDRGKDRHYVVVVLLDHDGRRSGESAFTKEFIVERAR